MRTPLLFIFVLYHLIVNFSRVKAICLKNVLIWSTAQTEKELFSTEKILSLNKLCCIILTVTHTDEHAFGGEKILASRVKMPVNPTG